MKIWIRTPKTNKTSQIVISGEYASGRKMYNPNTPTKKDFLPSGILKELEKK